MDLTRCTSRVHQPFPPGQSRLHARLLHNFQRQPSNLTGSGNHGLGGEPRAIFVLDLEASLPSEAKAHPVLRALNRSRELWERLRCPVVFWLAENAAALLAPLKYAVIAGDNEGEI